MAKASEHKAKMRKELWEAEMELSRTVVGLENAAQSFNGKAAALQLIPITAKNSNGIRCVRACVHARGVVPDVCCGGLWCDGR
jgi:hypothetical protein